jgi:glyoxylase-like metal-dependent hydrolase (beta-lactamase superfamily II)
MLAQGVRWFDDWFAIEDIAPGVIAVGEPRFHQFNWSYLIAGQRRALLFDTGTGVRDVNPVLRALTSLPVTVLPSHLHYDHTGNIHRFTHVAMADLPVLRQGEHDGLFHAPDYLFLGADEGMVWTPVKISAWLVIGSVIELGGRSLEIVHTPGHAPDHISLFDRHRGIFFAADFVYPGPLYAFDPGADLASYLETAKALAGTLDRGTRLFCAHGTADTSGKHRAPELAHVEIDDLVSALELLRASGTRPRTWPVNSRMSLLTGEAAFEAWQSP